MPLFVELIHLPLAKYSYFAFKSILFEEIGLIAASTLDI